MKIDSFQLKYFNVFDSKLSKNASNFQKDNYNIEVKIKNLTLWTIFLVTLLF